MSKLSKTAVQTVWVVSAHSESGDDYGPIVFARKPTDKELKALCVSWDSDDYGDGPGDYGSYCYLDVDEVEVRP